MIVSSSSLNRSQGADAKTKYYLSVYELSLRVKQLSNDRGGRPAFQTVFSHNSFHLHSCCNQVILMLDGFTFIPLGIYRFPIWTRPLIMLWLRVPVSFAFIQKELRLFTERHTNAFGVVAGGASSMKICQIKHAEIPALVSQGLKEVILLFLVKTKER